jgi:hypothetical protein
MIPTVSDLPLHGSADLLRELIERVQQAGRARFSMQSQIGDDDSPRIHSGVVDLVSGEYSSEIACFVNSVHYGRDCPEDDTWTSCPWDEGHLPISPLWLVLILHGAKTAETPTRDPRGDLAVSATCDLPLARRSSGVHLAGLGGDPQATVTVAVVADPKDRRPRRITASFDDWTFTCDLWDYGTRGAIQAPRASSSLASSSSIRRKIARVPILGFLFFAAEAARLKRIDGPPDVADNYNKP